MARPLRVHVPDMLYHVMSRGNEKQCIFTDDTAARPSLGTLFEGCQRQQELDEAAYRAFFEYAYTLVEIARVVSRHPSVVCRWVQRAKRKESARRVVASPGDSLAKNKI